MIRLGAIAIFLCLLTACGSLNREPNNDLVQRAIALQLVQMQQQLSHQLGNNFQSLKVERVAISNRDLLSIQNLPTYHLRGSYDLVLEFSTRQLNQARNKFDVYLQRQPEGKTWRLLIPQLPGKDTTTWLSYLIQ